MIISSILLPISRRVGALLLGGVVLWQVVEHCDPNPSSAIIHVTTPDVVVTVDGVEYPVESLWSTPLVCALSPGRHTVRMLKDGRVLYEEPFSLKPGEEIVLTAWDRYNDGRSPTWSDRGDETSARPGIGRQPR